jgi:phosphatidate cytidylyltransferase
VSTVWFLLLPVAGVFAASALLIHLLGSRQIGLSQELWRYFRSTALIVGLFLVPALLHPALFVLAVFGLGWRCMNEIALVFEVRVSGWRQIGLVAATACGVWVGLAQQTMMVLFMLALACPVYLLTLWKRPGNRLALAAAILFPMLAAAALATLIMRPKGAYLVFLLYATVEMHDSMAFLFGRLFGRRPILPRLSPRKTMEGALAGVILAGLFAWCLAEWLLDLEGSEAVTLAAVLVVSGVLGDMFASRLKRVAGVKDFPAVSVLHGGLLDIYDSTLFAAIPLAILVFFK